MSPALVSPCQEQGGTLGVSRKRAPEVIQGLETLLMQTGWRSSVYFVLFFVIYFSTIYQKVLADG